jgi:hypothetical protein
MMCSVDRLNAPQGLEIERSGVIRNTTMWRTAPETPRGGRSRERRSMGMFQLAECLARDGPIW